MAKLKIIYKERASSYARTKLKTEVCGLTWFALVMLLL